MRPPAASLPRIERSRESGKPNSFKALPVIRMGRKHTLRGEFRIDSLRLVSIGFCRDSGLGMHSLKALFLFTFVFVWGSVALAQVELEQVELQRPTPAPSDFQPDAWPEQFYQAAMSRGEKLEYRIINALFEGNTSFTVFNQSLPKIGSGSIRIGRNIYNNYDVMNTWTVIDTFDLGLSSQLYGASKPFQFWEPTPEQIIQFPVGSISFGVNGTLQIRDIRQLSPEKARTVEAPVFREDPSGEGDIQDLNPYLNSSPLDSPMRVKLKNLLNLVKLPFKIPFNRKDVKRMMKSEIISYTVSGTVGFGASIGWNYSPVPIVQASAGLSFEVHINGSYQIAILKEDDRFVRVRISRLKGLGGSSTLGTGVHFPDVFKGFVLFKGKKIETTVGRYSPSITPFRLSASESQELEIDVGYRYDLETPEGRDAFHRAVLGSFVRSDEQALEDAESKTPPVSKLYVRTTHRNSKGGDFSGNLNPIFRFDLNRGAQNVTTEIELPDGSKQYFQSSRSRSNDFDFLGNGQKVTHRTSILIDDQAFREKSEDSFLLMSENSIEDSYTFASSLNQHIDRVETDLGESGIFPRFPDRIPGKLGSKRSRKFFYGRSSFYFGMTFKLSGLKKFLETPWDQIQKRADELGLHLRQDHFEAAKDAFLLGDARKEYESLSKFFTNQRHSELYPKLLIEGLGEGLFERFLVAQNPAFGNIQVRGHTPLAMENTLRTTSQSMGMGTETDRTALDPNAIIKSFNSSRDELGRIVIHFNLAKNPEFLYFRIQPMARRYRHDSVEVIAYNRGNRFKEGENTLVLDPASTDPLTKKLSAKLISDLTYVATMGYSQKGSQWGFGASQRFDTSGFYPRPNQD